MEFLISEIAKEELIKKFHDKTLRVLPKTRT